MKAAGKRPSRSQKPIDLPQEMSPAECRQWLQEGAGAMGLALSALQLSQFMEYLFLLQKWNRVVNLTALNTRQEIIVKHFLDSLTLLPFLPKTFRLLDLGSGAGFPGLPVKIMAPELDVTLVEASSKKISFHKEVIRRLHLSGISAVPVYLKGDLPALPDFKEPFDIITTRAVALVDILTVAQACLAKGGKLILMKGKKGEQELITEAPLIQQAGFQMEGTVRLTLPFIDQARTLLFLTKTNN